MKENEDDDAQVAPITIADDNSESDIKLNISKDSHNLSGFFRAR
jgi:hypothetical protein